MFYFLQETYARGNELQVPDCTHYFMENLHRLSDANYVPTKVSKIYHTFVDYLNFIFIYLLGKIRDHIILEDQQGIVEMRDSSIVRVRGRP